VVPIGSTLVVRNRDDEAHTIHGRRGADTLFNIASVPSGAETRVRLDRAGVVRIGCDLHDEMHAFVLVSRAAHSAVTDRDGRFHIEDLQPGRHRLRIWYDDRGPLTKATGEPGRQAAEVEAGFDAAPVTLELPRLPAATAPLAAEPEPPATRPRAVAPPSWFSRLPPSWPTRPAWVLLLSAVGLAMAVALSEVNLRHARRRGRARVDAVLVGCGLAAGSGLLFALGLHPAVATALGFGFFIGHAIFAAAD
jgi:hypothetical protein